MAPERAPGRNLQNLSSNWKKLHSKLKEKDETESKKRKHSKEPQTNGAKRQRTDINGHVSPRRMGKPHVEGMNLDGDYIGAEKPAPSASLALWAADNDIPARDLAAAYGTNVHTTSIPTAQGTEERINEGLSTTAEAGKFIAIDCEMVGVGPNPDAESVLARVSIVNFHGHQVYDSFVQAKETVTDFRTHVSGITKELLQNARGFEMVQVDVAPLLDGKILVGHALKNDLHALLLSHPARDMRDTSKYPVFRQLAGGRTPGLKRLAKELLGVDIQGGEHSSIEDARAAMLLFRREKEGFEREHLARWGPDRRDGPKEGDEDDKDAKKQKKKKKKSKKSKKSKK